MVSRRFPLLLPMYRTICSFLARNLNHIEVFAFLWSAVDSLTQPPSWWNAGDGSVAGEVARRGGRCWEGRGRRRQLSHRDRGPRHDSHPVRSVCCMGTQRARGSILISTPVGCVLPFILRSILHAPTLSWAPGRCGFCVRRSCHRRRRCCLPTFPVFFVPPHVHARVR